MVYIQPEANLVELRFDQRDAGLQPDIFQCSQFSIRLGATDTQYLPHRQRTGADHAVARQVGKAALPYAALFRAILFFRCGIDIDLTAVFVHQYRYRGGVAIVIAQTLRYLVSPAAGRYAGQFAHQFFCRQAPLHLLICESAVGAGRQQCLRLLSFELADFRQRSAGADTEIELRLFLVQRLQPDIVAIASDATFPARCQLLFVQTGRQQGGAGDKQQQG